MVTPSEYISGRYFANDSEYFLTVDPNTLRTYIEKISSLKKIEIRSLAEIRKIYSNTKYVLALSESENKASLPQNAGFTHFAQIRNGIVLTADLCPSKLPADKNFFNILLDEFANIKRPVPIALCVSGLWLEKHIEDVKWIKNLEAKSLLSITWIGHSYNHRFLKDNQLKNNYLLLPDTNIDIEVLNTENKMLQSSITPSIFFRFPGLVSSRELF